MIVAVPPALGGRERRRPLKLERVVPGVTWDARRGQLGVADPVGFRDEPGDRVPRTAVPPPAAPEGRERARRSDAGGLEPASLFDAQPCHPQGDDVCAPQYDVDALGPRPLEQSELRGYAQR